MPENDRPGLRLAPDTQRRLDEVFHGQTCCQCCRKAERLSSGVYYCIEHFLTAGPGASAGTRVYRVSSGR
jgi:hypothetical protein